MHLGSMKNLLCDIQLITSKFLEENKSETRKKQNNRVEVTQVNNHDSSPILVEARTPSNLLLPDCINKRSIVLFGSIGVCDTEPTFFPLYHSTLNPVNNKTTETFYCPHRSYPLLFF